MSSAIEAAPEPRTTRTTRAAGRRPSPLWLVLVATALPMFMATLDNLVMTNALPVLHEEFGASVEELQWFMNAYTSPSRARSSWPSPSATGSGGARCFIGIVVFTLSSAFAARRRPRPAHRRGRCRASARRRSCRSRSPCWPVRCRSPGVRSRSASGAASPASVSRPGRSSAAPCSKAGPGRRSSGSTCPSASSRWDSPCSPCPTAGARPAPTSSASCSRAWDSPRLRARQRRGLGQPRGARQPHRRRHPAGLVRGVGVLAPRLRSCRCGCSATAARWRTS